MSTIETIEHNGHTIEIINQRGRSMSSGKMRYYLVKFVCVVAEYEFLSHTVLTLKPREKIETQIHKYFCDFYGDESLTEANRTTGSYLYNAGEVGVKVKGASEISEEQAIMLEGLGL